MQVVAGTEYKAITFPAAFVLARFLAERGQLEEAKALCDEYAAQAHEFGWRLWDPEVSAIRGLIAAGRRT